MFVIAYSSNFIVAALKSLLENPTSVSSHCWHLSIAFSMRVDIFLVLSMSHNFYFIMNILNNNIS